MMTKSEVTGYEPVALASVADSSATTEIGLTKVKFGGVLPLAPMPLSECGGPHADQLQPISHYRRIVMRYSVDTRIEVSLSRKARQSPVCTLARNAIREYS